MTDPVIGLNWTRDVSKLETIKEINQYFTDLLKKLEPKGDYDLVGYFDGSVVVAKQVMKGRNRKGSDCRHCSRRQTIQ